MTKQIIESDRPKKYYFELCLKMSQQKKLNQRERVFIELYQNEKVHCYHFTKQIKPTIIMYNSRICELRYLGFVIPPPEITYVKGQKHSTYNLDKTHFEVEAPRKKLFGLF